MPQPAGLPAADAVLARRAGENFPVTSRALPRRARGALLAIYGFARLTDELGDDPSRAPAERLAALQWLAQELDRAYAGRARHPLLVGLQGALRERPLPREPFERLIEANRVDQRVTRYDTWEQLLGYCRLSADPVGELVLAALGRTSPARVELSNHVCTALQLVEHWQDVAEDLEHRRVYLPREDMERFGVIEEDLRAPRAGWRLRGLLAYEVARTRELLDAGAPLLATVGGRERVALAAFVSGGRAALEAIERAGFDVLAPPRPPRAGRARRAAALVRTLAAERRG